MMKRENALQAVLDKAKVVETPPLVPKAPEPPAPRFSRPSRDSKHLIGGHFPKAVAKQLRLIAVEDDTTIQALLEEALDDLFVKKGRAKIVQLRE
jgi:antitoxin-like ribbon-helix-helix protein